MPDLKQRKSVKAGIVTKPLNLKMRQIYADKCIPGQKQKTCTDLIKDSNIKNIKNRVAGETYTKSQETPKPLSNIFMKGGLCCE